MSALKLKPTIVALAVALSGSAALAESMDSVVKTRPDQNIDQQYGRDSVYGFSAEAKPMKPEQSGSRDSNVLADVWHFTEGAAASAWAATTSVFKPSSSSAIAQSEPQPYGRAGGYFGSDRVSALSNTPTNSDIVVKSGEAVGGVADTGATVSDAGATGISSYNWNLR